MLEIQFILDVSVGLALSFANIGWKDFPSTLLAERALFGRGFFPLIIGTNLKV